MASVVGAGFALPRDAGRRPALHREIGVASVVGAGFALPRDAGRRPALLAVRLGWPASSVRVSRCRAMPVGDRRSTVRLGWPASSVRVSRCRAMPVGDRRSSRPCAFLRLAIGDLAACRATVPVGTPAVPNRRRHPVGHDGPHRTELAWRLSGRTLTGRTGAAPCGCAGKGISPPAKLRLGAVAAPMTIVRAIHGARQAGHLLRPA